ncbi:MAG: hypothetical protein AAFN63_04105 [Pseudomonadota bacterium]
MGQSFQVHIQQLFQAGIATHFVANSAALDPIFALSKTQDFPQITFAAAFDDGTVALGCKGALPEPLVDVAQPITPHNTPADQTEAKLDAIAAQLQQMQGADRQTTTSSPEFDRVLASLDGQLALGEAIQEQIASMAAAIAAKPKGNDDGALGTLQTQLAQLFEQMQAAPDTSALEQLRAEVAQIIPVIEGKAETDDTKEAIADLETRLTAQIADLPNPQTDAIVATQQGIEQTLTTLSNDVKSLITMQGAVQSDGQLAEIMARLDDLPGLAALDEKYGSIVESLRQLKESAPTAPADDHLSTQINALAAEIASISQRPAPTLDLTEQRQNLARFQTAMATVLERLEQAITHLTTANDDSGDSAISAQLDRLLETITPVTSLPAQLADLGASVTPLSQQFSDLGERMETVTQEVPQTPDLTPLLERQRTAFDALQAELLSLIDRPAPTIDLTAQRASFAHFANALGTVLDRFERVATQFEAPAMAPPPADEPKTDPAPFSDARISLEALRIDFAELIAKQIMESSAADTEPPQSR